ncbi:MAG: hypothetical protein SFW35_13170 [Chitinophagales bacterium]|nr:hypothetical protein [Chitinophagales bacterium]
MRTTTMHIGKGIVAVLLLIAAQPLLAQVDTSRLDTSVVNVINPFQPIIAESEKLSYPPKEIVTAPEKTELSYYVPVKLFRVNYPPVSIKPLAVSKERPLSYPGAYLKLGFGTQVSPLAELLYTGRKLKGEEEKMNYGLFFRHFSGRGFKLDNQDFSDNNAALFASFYPGKTLKIDSRIDFERDARFYYGYNHADTTYDRDDVKQNYTDINFNIGLSNSRPTKMDIDHETRFNAYYFFDRFDQSDLGFNVFTKLKKTFNSVHEVQLHLEDDYSVFQNRTVSQSNNIFLFKPGYRYMGGAWEVSGAIGIALDDKTFYPLPDIKAQWGIIQDKVIVYGGWNFELRNLTYKQLTDRNPWIKDNTFLLRNTRFEDRFAGLKGTISKVSYDFQFAHKVMRQMPLFINDTIDPSKFLIVYNAGTLRFFDIHGQLEYRALSNLAFTLTGDYNIYNPEFEAEAWHLSPFLVNLNVRYNIVQKIFLTMDVFGIGGAKARLANGTATTLNSTVDINLGATYKFSKYFSFFAELNNLAHIKYEPYLYYPTYGFNGRLGIILTYQP